jgi:hypothetical protein
MIVLAAQPWFSSCRIRVLYITVLAIRPMKIWQFTAYPFLSELEMIECPIRLSFVWLEKGLKIKHMGFSSWLLTFCTVIRMKTRVWYMGLTAPSGFLSNLMSTTFHRVGQIYRSKVRIAVPYALSSEHLQSWSTIHFDPSSQLPWSPPPRRRTNWLIRM